MVDHTQRHVNYEYRSSKSGRRLVEKPEPIPAGWAINRHYVVEA